jgi:pilus assembly protein CpaD
MNFRTITTLVSLGIAVSACGTSSRGLESVHQPVVSRADYAFDVNTSGEGLAGIEAARLAGWFDALNLGYGDKIAVDFGGAYNDAGAKAAIASVAARYGLLLQDNAPMVAGALQPGTARVVVSRLKASVPSCPDWSSNKGPNFNNDSWSGFGCATNTNLAAMVADPEDFIRGKAGDVTIDTASSGKAVKAYRTAAPTGSGSLKAESTGGK